MYLNCWNSSVKAGQEKLCLSYRQKPSFALPPSVLPPEEIVPLLLFLVKESKAKQQKKNNSNEETICASHHSLHTRTCAPPWNTGESDSKLWSSQIRKGLSIYCVITEVSRLLFVLSPSSSKLKFYVGFKEVTATKVLLFPQKSRVTWVFCLSYTQGPNLICPSVFFPRSEPSQVDITLFSLSYSTSTSIGSSPPLNEELLINSIILCLSNQCPFEKLEIFSTSLSEKVCIHLIREPWSSGTKALSSLTDYFQTKEEKLEYILFPPCNCRHSALESFKSTWVTHKLCPPIYSMTIFSKRSSGQRETLNRISACLEPWHVLWS